VEGSIGSLRSGTPAARWVLAATVLGSGVVFLDGTVVNVALPTISRDFHAPIATLQWTIDAYLVTLSALLLLGGSLGDRYGRRSVFVVGLAWFVAASMLCAIAPTSGVLVAARALQGVGGALLVPGSLAIISTTFHPDDRGHAIGVWSGLAGVVSVKATDRKGGGGIVQIETLSRLLESAGFVPGTGHSDAFHDLMLNVWSLDIPGARVALTAPPLRPSDPLVAFERQRVDQLAGARARLVPIEHTVSILRMVALTSLLAAGILIARLVQLASESSPPQESSGS
jgi:MFS family permease